MDDSNDSEATWARSDHAVPMTSGGGVRSSGVKVPDPRTRPTMSVQEAGRLFGFGKTKSYEEVHRYLRSGGREGLPVIRFGRSLVCPTAQVLALLGMDEETVAQASNGDRDDRRLTECRTGAGAASISLPWKMDGQRLRVDHRRYSTGRGA
jgi:hypothetical protein